MTVLDETVEFKVFESLKFPKAADDSYSVECNSIEVVNSAVQDELTGEISKELLDWICDAIEDDEEIQQGEVSEEDADIEEVSAEVENEINKSLIPSVSSPPILELKQLPSNLKYAFLRANDTLPVIIVSDLEAKKEERLLKVLQEHKAAIGWTIADIKGISPATCMHHILLEEGMKPSREAQ